MRSEGEDEREREGEDKLILQNDEVCFSGKDYLLPLVRRLICCLLVQHRGLFFPFSIFATSFC